MLLKTQYNKKLLKSVNFSIDANSPKKKLSQAIGFGSGGVAGI
jgi:hypothetical protein